MRFLYSILLILAFIVSCNNAQDNAENKTQPTNGNKAANYFRITHPTRVDTLRNGDSLWIEVQARRQDVGIDSVKVDIAGRTFHTGSDLRFPVIVQAPEVGLQNIGVEVYLSNGEKQKKSVKQFFVSDIEPAQLRYEVVKELKHNSRHYTQGLEIHEGFLYEGVGHYGRSAIYKKELRGMGELQQVKLPSNRFGEGITIVNNRIYQLTYQAREAYIYDLASMNLMQTIPYPMRTEGWGLTHDAQNLIMSSGQPKLYILDPASFSLIDEQTVCDHKGPVDKLNELEYVDGFVFANIWMEHDIAKIDLNTGKVVAYLDLTELVPPHLRSDNDNVLNGIAYNAETDTYFVTGKRWAVMYEIRLLD